tara:strand:+ start:1938 stop:2594 length:657 start_codon:yes stop_codon:yes gene_type:complete
MTYVYLKFGQYAESETSDLTINTIPLNVTSVGVSVSKTIPSFPIPFSGIVTGESVTAALDLGMATKQIDLSGFISETTIRKTRTAFNGATEDDDTARVFTAHEIAQMIASGVDSTGLQNNQSMNELVILYPSNVDEKYRDRDNGGTGSRGHLIPFNFASRGTEGFGDNLGVSYRGSSFPESSTSTGMSGFIRSFSFNMEAEAIDLSFSMQFEVAIIGP